ncbi:MAG: hypothetical protein WC768_00140 [Patescibacteria group bacterium]|jgi:hypothetical protein
MPLKQLHVVKKIKFLASSIFITKKQIVDEVEKNAQKHHLINQRQEEEDDARVDHAQKELKKENEIANSNYYSLIFKTLVISVFVNLIFLAALALVIIFFINKNNYYG